MARHKKQPAWKPGRLRRTTNTAGVNRKTQSSFLSSRLLLVAIFAFVAVFALGAFFALFALLFLFLDEHRGGLDVQDQGLRVGDDLTHRRGQVT